MKTLSLRQPWLWAVLNAGKTLENRQRHDGRMPHFMRHRGPLALHASAGASRAYWKAACEELEAITRPSGIALPDFATVERGCVLAVCDVTAHVDPRGWVHISPDDPAGSFDSAAMGLDMKWKMEGSWAFVLHNVRRVKPLVRKGALGMFETPDHLLEVLS